jgi:hypothetical protein
VKKINEFRKIMKDLSGKWRIADPSSEGSQKAKRSNKFYQWMEIKKEVAEEG